MLSTCVTHFLRATLLVTLLVAAGCQTAPVQEMSDARQAISVAREAGAEEHAASDLSAAVEYLHSAEGFINERNYDLARRDAINAKTSALDALKRVESSTDPETP